MWSLVQAGGWLMLPIILCSVVALVIIIERAKVLRFSEVAPEGMREELIGQLRSKGDLGKNFYKKSRSTHHWVIFWLRVYFIDSMVWIQ